MRRCSALIGALLIMVLSLAIVATPSDTSADSARQWQRIIDEFGLETVDQAPPGVTPLVVHSPAQLRRLLAVERPRHLVLEITETDLHALGASAGGAFATATTYVPLHAWNSSQWPIVFHLYAEVWVTGSGSFWEIIDCDDWAEFTGWEAFSETGGEWSRHRIASDRQSIKIEGGGYIKHYIWTPLGKIHVMTYRFKITINYRIS